MITPQKDQASRSFLILKLIFQGFFLEGLSSNINLKSRKEKRLTNLWTLDTEPEFSPNGEKLIFLSSRNDKVRRQLFIGDKKLKTVSVLTPDNVEVLDASWSLSGDQVVFSLFQQRRFVIMIKDLQTGKNKFLNIKDKGYQYQPKFRPMS